MLRRGSSYVSLSDANFHRDREQGLVGSAMQSVPTYHISNNEITRSTLGVPKAKDKLIDGANTFTVNTVEAKMLNGVIVGWRLRVGG